MRPRVVEWLSVLGRRGGPRARRWAPTESPQPQVIPTRHGWLDKLGWALGISEFS